MKKLINIVKSKLELSVLIILIILTLIITYYHNSKKIYLDKKYKQLINNIYLNKSIDNLYSNFQPKFKTIAHIIEDGENLNSILKKYEIDPKEIEQISKILSNTNETKILKIKKKIDLVIDQTNKSVKEFSYPISKSKKILLTRNDENIGLFNKKILITDLKKKIIYSEDSIITSLYKSAEKNNIPPNVIIEFARIYGFQVDFQRDIKKNDTFQIMYEVFVDKNQKIIQTGEILFSNLILSGVENSLYYFKKKNFEGHFDISGKSVKKALMKTPINGARLSSPFGMRKHPIDGFNKMHKGTDFAAPLGTPIMASGDGIITKVGWCGGGGNCIKIKHNKTYQTVYAHMSKFANGIKKGVRVRQAQIIGFVGSTGKSTGPHLHYEVIVNGKKVNSQKLRLPSGKVLKGKERILFETERIKLDVLKSEIIIGIN